jgi:hypothetical protein
MEMTMKKILISAAVAVLGLAGLHAWLNLGGPAGAGHENAREQKLRVGFLPVT